MNIGVLCISLGRYQIYWPDFLISCEKYFLTNSNKHFFLVTDSIELKKTVNVSKVTIVDQNDLGWPGNTLKRFDFFLKKENELLLMDFLFFFNGNCLFVDKVGESEFIPNIHENFVASSFYRKDNLKFPYERNPKSTAYIPYGEGKYYVQGGLSGGRSRDFVEAMKVMKRNIEIDENNGFVARVHDESHWNKFVLGRDDVKMLPDYFLYPEGSEKNTLAKIVLRAKTQFGNLNGIRNTRNYKFEFWYVKKIPQIIKSALIFFVYSLFYYYFYLIIVLWHILFGFSKNSMKKCQIDCFIISENYLDAIFSLSSVYKYFESDKIHLYLNKKSKAASLSKFGFDANSVQQQKNKQIEVGEKIVTHGAKEYMIIVGGVYLRKKIISKIKSFDKSLVVLSGNYLSIKNNNFTDSSILSFEEVKKDLITSFSGLRSMICSGFIYLKNEAPDVHIKVNGFEDIKNIYDFNFFKFYQNISVYDKLIVFNEGIIAKPSLKNISLSRGLFSDMIKNKILIDERYGK